MPTNVHLKSPSSINTNLNIKMNENLSSVLKNRFNEDHEVEPK